MPAGTASQQNLAKMQNDVNARITALEAQISNLNQQIAGAPKAKRQQLIAQKESAQGELDLRNAMHQTLEQMTQFISTNGEAGKAGWRAASMNCGVRFRNCRVRAASKLSPSHPR